MLADPFNSLRTLPPEVPTVTTSLYDAPNVANTLHDAYRDAAVYGGDVQGWRVMAARVTLLPGFALHACTRAGVVDAEALRVALAGIEQGWRDAAALVDADKLKAARVPAQGEGAS